MARGKKTVGRQKGVPNRATAANAAEIAASGLTPLDYMLTIMRDDSQPPTLRAEMAKAAAPYVPGSVIDLDEFMELPKVVRTMGTGRLRECVR